MPLPTAPLARGTVEVAGETVEVRSLTRAEALAMRAIADRPDAERAGEVYLIAHGLDISEEEAGAWWDASDPMAVQKLVQGIAVVSRLIGSDGTAPNSPPSAASSTAT
jgi:hypothetical protein